MCVTMEAQNDGGYEESLLNIVLDEIDDIIIIHDSEHTVVWMNRAGTEKFHRPLETVVGKSCFTLFGRTTPCDDCQVISAIRDDRYRSERIIPTTGEKYKCITMPLTQDGEVKLVVQHLRKA
ncbi:MAG: PAS domain-containing protein [Methanomassiliicoccaceae archaeon]|nr:PAS domain-containing protein [Methanomassiliicoccaceae archaeon]